MLCANSSKRKNKRSSDFCMADLWYPKIPGSAKSDGARRLGYEAWLVFTLMQQEAKSK